MCEYAKFFTLRHQQEFVVPTFDNDDEHMNESFLPFVRFDEPWNLYEKLKTIFLFLFTVLPFKLLFAMVGLPGGWLFALLGSIGFDSRNDNDLIKPISKWRQIMFTISRFLGHYFNLLFFGVYKFKKIKLTYNDILYNKNNDINYRLDYENDYFLRCMYENYICQNKEPPCYTIVSNHNGHIDILTLLYSYSGSFVSQLRIRNAPFIGTICNSLYPLWLKKGANIGSQLKKRMLLTYEMHVDKDNGYKLKNKCVGCSYCTSNLVVFPEGTSTNCSCLLGFRKGVFNAGLPVKPIIFRFPWKSVNSCWESTWYDTLSYRLSTQFINYIEIIECPPYLPNKYERENASLYAFNVNLFMAKIMEYNINGKNNKYNEYPSTKLMRQRLNYLDKFNPKLSQIYKNKLNKKELHCPIYLLNRNHKIDGYQKLLGFGWTSNLVNSVCKSFEKDETLDKYKEWNEKYVEYLEYLQQQSNQSLITG